MTRSLRLLTTALLLLLCACSSSPTARNPRDSELTNYGVAIRWNEFADAQQFVDPLLREQQALSDLELERFKQIQVTGYDVKSKHVAADGSVQQVVEIRLISRNTQIERTVTDRQTWRWDAEGKRYWLTSGLPDFTAR